MVITRSKGGIKDVIRWEIGKDSITEEDSYSHTVEMGGMPWSLCVRKRNDHLGIYFQSMDGDYTVQSVEVAMEFKLINHKKDANTVTYKYSYSFEKISRWGYDEFIRWNDAINAEKGFIEDNKFTVQVRFWLMNTIGFRVGRDLSSAKPTVKPDNATSGIIEQEFHKDFISSVPCLSVPISVGGMQWRIKLETTAKDEYLSVSLSQYDDIYELQSVDVTNEYKLIHNRDDSKTIARKMNQSAFTKENHCWGCTNFIKWSDVINVRKGFIKNDRIKVRIEFSLSNLSRHRTVIADKLRIFDLQEKVAAQALVIQELEMRLDSSQNHNKECECESGNRLVTVAASSSTIPPAPPLPPPPAPPLPPFYRQLNPSTSSSIICDNNKGNIALRKTSGKPTKRNANNAHPLSSLTPNELVSIKRTLKAIDVNRSPGGTPQRSTVEGVNGGSLSMKEILSEGLSKIKQESSDDEEDDQTDKKEDNNWMD